MAGSSFSLAYLAESELSAGHFASIGVVSLFANVPVDETIDVILDALFPSLPGVDPREQGFEGVSGLIFGRSLEWCLGNNVFVFGSGFCKQIDGCAVGSPLAPILADIFMNFLLEPGVVRSEHGHLDLQFLGFGQFDSFSVELFVRCVDGTLVVFDGPGDADRFVAYLNSLHPSMKFAMEHEVLDGLAFLDLLLIRVDNGVEIAVCGGPTHSGVFAHFTSFVPYPFEVGLIGALLGGACRICSG